MAAERGIVPSSRTASEYADKQNISVKLLSNAV